MKKQLIKDALVWGSLLWLFGYVLGIVAFMLVPTELIGWVVSPIGVLLTLLVLWKKIKGKTLLYYVKLGAIWTVLAITLDYLFIVKLFNAGIAYYKIDVYLYYFLTLTLPWVVGWYRNRE